jgi:adenylate kinase
VIFVNLIILGAPGAGKGTQAKVVAERLDIAHISTGDLLRDELKRDTGTSRRIKEIMNAGELVPDDIVVNLLDECVKQAANGFILDGFPRNLAQAKALDDKGFKIDAAITLDISDEAIVERLSGRLFCPKCGATYHVAFNKPKEDGACDTCGETLAQRADDNKDTVLNRLKVYHKETEPIIDYYKQKGILTVIDGAKGVDDIAGDILSALGKAAN